VLEIAQELCHRVGIVTAGQMVAMGTLHDLRQQAQREAASLEELFLQLTDGAEG
jgi:ABC-2 type transport system ATP-binding protein